MAEPRRYIGVRISEQGHRYIQQVADRDRVNYSEALRRLLAVGAKTDMEAHDDNGRPAGASPDQSRGVDQLGPDDNQHRDRNGDPSSDQLPRLPDSGPAGIGEAIGHLHRAGLNPSAIEAQGDGPSAA